jgi:hypothetical protein
VILEFESSFRNIRVHVYRYVTLCSSYGTSNFKTAMIMVEDTDEYKILLMLSSVNGNVIQFYNNIIPYNMM